MNEVGRVLHAAHVPGSELYVHSCACEACAACGACEACGDVPDISSGMASHDTRMSLFLAAFFVACIDSDVLLLLYRVITHFTYEQRRRQRHENKKIHLSKLNKLALHHFLVLALGTSSGTKSSVVQPSVWLEELASYNSSNTRSKYLNLQKEKKYQIIYNISLCTVAPHIVIGCQLVEL